MGSNIKHLLYLDLINKKELKSLQESLKNSSEETAETEGKIKEIKDKQFEITKKLLTLDKEATEEVKKRSDF